MPKKLSAKKPKKNLTFKKIKKQVKKMVKKKVKKNSPNKKSMIKSKRKVLAQPKGYHAITPYLIVNGAANAIVFYKTAFGCKEVMRMEQPDGKIGHAEL